MATETIQEVEATTVPFPRRMSRRGEPTWDIAHFFPRQGYWTEAQYLALNTNWMAEYVEGCVEVLGMPTYVHGLIVDYLVTWLKGYLMAAARGGKVLFAPIPVRLYPGTYREPDVFYLSDERCKRVDKYPDGADLIMEVVSDGEEDRKRDYVDKRADYAKAGVAEYWIVDPRDKKVTVLTLSGQEYLEHGVFGPGMTADSVLLAGLSVQVDDVFAAAAAPNHASSDAADPPA